LSVSALSVSALSVLAFSESAFSVSALSVSALSVSAFSAPAHSEAAFSGPAARPRSAHRAEPAEPAVRVPPYESSPNASGPFSFSPPPNRERSQGARADRNVWS
jgi:hypothetical protein